MRYWPIFALLSLAGCHIDVIPPQSLTLTAMGETEVRIGIYYEANKKLPANLDVLPARKGYSNRIVDAWKRPLRYVVDPNGDFSLGSYGKDGVIGGVGDDRDWVTKYRVLNGEVSEVPGQPR